MEMRQDDLYSKSPTTPQLASAGFDRKQFNINLAAVEVNSLKWRGRQNVSMNFKYLQPLGNVLCVDKNI